MESPAFKERRAFTRFPVKISVRYFDLDIHKESRAQTRDISAKGIGLFTRETLAPETPLDIWLEMPDTGEQIYIKGRVVWSNLIESDKYRVGINLENAELNPILLALKAIQVRIKHY